MGKCFEVKIAKLEALCKSDYWGQLWRTLLKCSVKDAQGVLTAYRLSGLWAVAGMPLWGKAQLSVTLSGQKGIPYLS